MKAIMYVSEASQRSSGPGESSNVLRLALPPKTGLVDDENKEIFPDSKTKSGVVEFQGLSDEAIAAYKGGKRVTVTIEIEA